MRATTSLTALGDFSPLHLDLTEEGCAEITAAVRELWGALDVLCWPNAAIPRHPGEPLVRGRTLPGFRALAPEKRHPPFRLTMALLPLLRLGREPRVVHVGSGAGTFDGVADGIAKATRRQVGAQPDHPAPGDASGRIDRRERVRPRVGEDGSRWTQRTRKPRRICRGAGRVLTVERDEEVLERRAGDPVLAVTSPHTCAASPGALLHPLYVIKRPTLTEHSTGTRRNEILLEQHVESQS